MPPVRESALPPPLPVAERRDRIPLGPLLFLVVLAAVGMLIGPDVLTMGLIGVAGAIAIGKRPQLGVALLLALLMVQYGQRGTEREGVANTISNLVPQGTGFLTINNALGGYLVLLLVYDQFFEKDWSFLKNRIFMLILAVTIIQVFSGLISGIKFADQIAMGLQSTSAEDPSRVLVTRALFVALFLYFVREPRDLRMILALFIVLTVVTAWTGSQAALTGYGAEDVARMSAGRAGGLDVLIQSSKNPNRLALIATLGLVYIWEYSQAHQMRQWFRWVALGVALLMIVTVFLTASRGGLIGLLVVGAMLFVRKSGGSGRWLYGLAAVALAGVLIEELVPEESMQRITNIPGISKDDPNAPGAGSTERRAYIFSIGFQIWEKAPIVGVGPGNWSYIRYQVDPIHSVAVAHDSYLAALAEGGVISLGLYLLLFYVTIRDLLRCERAPPIVEWAKADNLEWMLAATRICMIGFMVFSIFSDLWDLIFSYFLLAVAAALTQRYQPSARKAYEPFGAVYATA
jgi:O-antigen ligase